MHATKLASYDYISVFNFKNSEFEECQRTVLYSSRWFPYPGGKKNDESVAFGAHLKDQNSMLLCPFPIYYCLVIKVRAGQMVFTYNKEILKLVANYPMLNNPGIGTIRM